MKYKLWTRRPNDRQISSDSGSPCNSNRMTPRPRKSPVQYPTDTSSSTYRRRERSNQESTL
eukprot:6818214-Pyramimonas_sp.AAC.1